MTEQQKKQLRLLNTLTHNGIKVLEIWHKSEPDKIMFYETGDFRAASKETFVHSISRCKDITEIINEKTSLYSNSPDYVRSVITAIEQNQEEPVNKNFSQDFSFIWHV